MATNINTPASESEVRKHRSQVADCTSGDASAVRLRQRCIEHRGAAVQRPDAGGCSKWSSYRRRLTQKPSSVALNAPTFQRKRTGNDSRKTFAYVRISACVLVFLRDFGLVRSRRRPSGPSHRSRNSRRRVVLSMAICFRR